MARRVAVILAALVCASCDSSSNRAEPSTVPDYGLEEIITDREAVINGGSAEWHVASIAARRDALGHIVFDTFGPGSVDPFSSRERELAKLALEPCVEANISNGSFRQVVGDCISNLGIDTM